MKIKSTKDVAAKRAIFLVVGPSGIGKTSLARTLPENDTLIISAESGLLCLKGTSFDVVEISNMEELREVFVELAQGKNQYKNIFIDSLTELGEICLNALKEDPKYSDPKQTMKMYGKYNDDFTAIIKGFRDMNQYNVVMTCLEKQEQDGTVLQPQFDITGGKIKDRIKSWFDIVMHYHVYDHEGERFRKLVTTELHSPLAKDRSGLLEEYENPHLGEIMSKILD